MGRIDTWGGRLAWAKADLRSCWRSIATLGLVAGVTACLLISDTRPEVLRAD